MELICVGTWTEAPLMSVMVRIPDAALADALALALAEALADADADALPLAALPDPDPPAQPASPVSIAKLAAPAPILTNCRLLMLSYSFMCFPSTV